MQTRPTRPTAMSVILADCAMIALCVTAMYWLLYSPLVPIPFTATGLIVGALLLGLPLGSVGIILNHRAARSSAGGPVRQAWPRGPRRKK